MPRLQPPQAPEANRPWRAQARARVPDRTQPMTLACRGWETRRSGRPPPGRLARVRMTRALGWGVRSVLAQWAPEVARPGQTPVPVQAHRPVRSPEARWSD